MTKHVNEVFGRQTRQGRRLIGMSLRILSQVQDYNPRVAQLMAHVTDPSWPASTCFLTFVFSTVPFRRSRRRCDPALVQSGNGES